MTSTEILARRVLDACRNAGLLLATAESCTGGMIASALTDIAGSSKVFDRGFVTYSNEAKIEMLGVESGLVGKYGAVSEQTAEEMAHGAIANSRADIAVAVTGIAGPGGGSPEKPVGTVWFAIAIGGEVEATLKTFEDHGRAAIRKAATIAALELLLERVS